MGMVSSIPDIKLNLQGELFCLLFLHFLYDAGFLHRCGCLSIFKNEGLDYFTYLPICFI